VVKTFIDRFFAAAPKLNGSGYSASWCQVDLAAPVPGWDRFDAATQWLSANPNAQTKICPESPPVIVASNGPPSCDVVFRTEMRRDAGTDPDLSKAFWQERFADWKRKAAGICQ
jgi:hypothetical protein